jgi:hypothetical protein
MDGTRRLTLREAAGDLGVSIEAVRKRVKRGSLRSEKAPDGRVYVYLDAGGDAGGEPGLGAASTDVVPLVAELRKTVEDLRVRLDRSEQANAEMRRIVAGLVQRVPELEAPQGPPGGSENDAVGSEG